MRRLNDGVLYYSTLKQKVSNLPMNKASPQQWRNTICNLSKSGVREEEIICSGILEWLEKQTASLSRHELFDHINFDQIEIRLVTEINKVFPHLEFYECNQPLDKKKHKWVNKTASVNICYYERSFGYQIVNVKRIGLFGDKDYWMLLGYEGEIILPELPKDLVASDGWTTAEAAMDIANQDARERYGHLDWFTAARTWRYETWLGGKNYREWLLTVPEFPESFYSQHFSTRNIVAHVRSDERHDVFDRRLLFIHEIQSDWHQNGRLKGYSDTCVDSNIPYGPFADSWHELAIKTMCYMAVTSGVEGIAWTTGAQQVQRWKHYYVNNNTAALTGLTTFYDKIIPKFIRQFTKRFHGTISETSFETKEQKYYASKTDDGWVLMDENEQEPISESFKSRKVVEDIACRKSATTYENAPVLLMTDAMKTHIKQHGVPLFGNYLT